MDLLGGFDEEKYGGYLDSGDKRRKEHDNGVSLTWEEKRDGGELAKIASDGSGRLEWLGRWLGGVGFPVGAVIQRGKEW